MRANLPATLTLIFGLGVIGASLVLYTFAAGPAAYFLVKNAALSSGASVVANSAAIGGSMVQFGGGGVASPSPSPSSTPTSPSPSPSQAPTPTPPLVATPKIMVLGDSISAGNADEVMNGYRLELMNRLPGYSINYVGSLQRGDSRLADKDMQAEGGACIKGDPCWGKVLYHLTANWVSSAQPDVVIMNGGSNDYCCGREDQSDSMVIQSMTDWINLVFATKPGVYIIVIGMPPYHDGYKNWIPTYVQQQAALGRRISYVSMDGVETYDTVHPNINGYKTLAGRITTVLKPIMQTLTGH